jgi:hypothetical protein
MDTKNDTNKDVNKDTNKDTKQAATSVVAGTGTGTGTATPGAIHVDESSMEGQQSEVVKEVDSSKTRSRALLGAGIVVILLLATIIGSVIGTRDTKSPNAVAVPATTEPTTTPKPTTASSVPSPSPSMKPTRTPTFASLDNNFCEEAHLINLGDAPIAASLENAMQQSVVFCQGLFQLSDSQPGLWCKVRGVRASSIFRAWANSCWGRLQMARSTSERQLAARVYFAQRPLVVGTPLLAMAKGLQPPHAPEPTLTRRYLSLPVPVDH